jgi:ABC-type sugar transport system permease subunit
VGLANYAEILAEPRFFGALAHTLFFTAVSVALELGAGLALALAMNGGYRGRGAVRVSVLLPWAIPTVVAALIWRFLFEGPGGVANVVVMAAGASEPISWFSDAWLAWVPIVLADVWKTTPFVALLLLAGLQSIDPELYEAARVDGAGRIRQLFFVTLPFLRPAILVALIFRTLDAFRVFDLIYVLTGGGPGTATEPLALYTWSALLQNLRFGFGSALSVLIFLVTFALALIYVRLVGADLTRGVR